MQEVWSRTAKLGFPPQHRGAAGTTFSMIHLNEMFRRTLGHLLHTVEELDAELLPVRRLPLQVRRRSQGENAAGDFQCRGNRERQDVPITNQTFRRETLEFQAGR